MPELDGKVAVVTGAGGGLGRRYALELAAAGAKVLVNDLSVTVAGGSLAGQHLADSVVAEIIAAGGEAVANTADVSDPDTAATICADAVAAFGQIDILVNNAGIVRDGPFDTMPLANWHRVVDVHLHGTFNVTQPIFWHMVDRGSGGVIVNTTSRSGIRGKTGQANYAAAKAGIIGLTSVLALEGRAYGIRAWTIAPRFASRAWEGGTVTSSGVINDELRTRYTSDAAALTMLYMVSDRSAPLSGKVVFASADGIQEMRWHGAEPWEPTGRPASLDALDAAIRQGRVLFVDESNLGTPI
ncbi:SDR family NAD(P)-dependent oxidoreductase [Dactylosporangium sp. NPDC005572]|uniref:SDR family NAD(P)-dependent oxidoreductase n=1 Tax=Dactylosporangium sp. NPDC005572 TaxID=3156889 RepID=UPI0033A40854